MLRITADAYARRFGDRPSFELDGRQLIGNPPIEYEYLQVSLTARQRIGDRFWFGFGFLRTEREDTYLGYNNYTRNTYQVDVNWRPGRKLRLEASAYYRVYDFENAFAFHDPAAGRKTLESMNVVNIEIQGCVADQQTRRICLCCLSGIENLPLGIR